MTANAANESASPMPDSLLRSMNGAARRTRGQTRWRVTYARRLLVTDIATIVAVVFTTQVIWLSAWGTYVAPDPSLGLPILPYWLVSSLVVLAWVWALSLADSRSPRVIGFGATEYIRVADSSLRVFGTIAIVSFLLQADLARGYLLISLPVGLFALLLTRALWRRWLIHQRRHGEYSARVLLVGSQRSVADTAIQLQRLPQAGYLVVGACVPSGRVADAITGTAIPIMGTVDAVDRAMIATRADTVIVTSTDELPADKVKQISWGLEAGRQHLVIAPSLADIAGPRIHTRPVAGLPLIHVETPRFSGGQRVAKRALDVVASGLGIVLLSPLLAVLALLVKSDPGPVLFRQRRVGLGGQEFTMLKFRSMVVDAEKRLAELTSAERDAGNSVLFKMKNDPRVTPVGRLMRKFSLDELPQLFNVLGGSMSLVGPRPPLPSEVAVYEDHVHRRFLAKPGITGLWQVSGRSTLSWDESVRLDLSYVENWSFIGDIVILLKTAKAVFAPGETAH